MAALVGGLLSPMVSAGSAAAQPNQHEEFEDPGVHTFTVPGSPTSLKTVTIKVWGAGAGGSGGAGGGGGGGGGGG
ncbi:hypothetical protein PBV88_54550, partial [Streptomyces sp. T21Q-yed]|nr:hypothetical protein [Streptomyces sp. T21Q-yed]